MTKNILIYDLATMPIRRTVNEIMRGYNEQGIVLWCSAASHNFSGKNIINEPKVINRETLEKADGITFYDTAGMSEEEIDNLISKSAG